MIALQLLLLLGAAFASVQAQVFNCVGCVSSRSDF